MPLQSLLHSIVFLVLGAPVAIGAATFDFSDVPDSAWFAASVHDAVSAWIVSGYKDGNGNPTGKFGPENRITVGEALKISLESAGFDVNRGQGYGHWAARYLSIAIGEHFALTPDANINLDRSATRAELASLIADAFRVSMPASQTQQFKDVSSSSRFSRAINALGRDRILSGDTDASGNATGIFRPDSFVNRAETVKIAMSARVFYRNSGFISSGSSRSVFLGECGLQECGYAPAMPNWQCPDGSLGGPACQHLPDGRCGWLIRQCFSSSRSSSSSSSHLCPTFNCPAPRQGCSYDPTYDKFGCPQSCGMLQCSSSSRSFSRSSARSTSSGSQLSAVVVLFTSAGFSPSVLHIRLGQKVIFKNTTNDDVRVASNPHPAHTDYSGFDSGRSLLKDEEYGFTFTRKGTFGYHNHLSPDKAGKVVVE